MQAGKAAEPRVRQRPASYDFIQTYLVNIL